MQDALSICHAFGKDGRQMGHEPGGVFARFGAPLKVDHQEATRQREPAPAVVDSCKLIL